MHLQNQWNITHTAYLDHQPTSRADRAGSDYSLVFELFHAFTVLAINIPILPINISTVICDKQSGGCIWWTKMEARGPVDQTYMVMIWWSGEQTPQTPDYT